MVSRLITINIRKYLVRQPRNKRGRKAVSYLRARVSHYTKTNPENVRISKELNQLIMKSYSRRMIPIKVSVNIEKDRVTVMPFGEQKASEAPKVQERKGEKPKEQSAQTSPDAKRAEKAPEGNSTKTR